VVSAVAAVQLDGVGKEFATDAGLVSALAGVTLTVAPGSSLAITGPSGCGKSTLLSIIGGLERPSCGRVAVGGRVVSSMGERDRARLRRERLGFVFQSHNLQPFLTVVENVSLQLELSGQSTGAERALELVAALGLGGAADAYPDQLSGGERQRVAVARALVHRPELILADEPTGSLDPGNSAAVVDLLVAARAEVGATLIVITHDAEVAERLDARVRMRDGRVLEAPPDGDDAGSATAAARV
jgi:putative ABC transport system ATP-binding protein